MDGGAGGRTFRVHRQPLGSQMNSIVMVSEYKDSSVVGGMFGGCFGVIGVNQSRPKTAGGPLESPFCARRSFRANRHSKGFLHYSDRVLEGIRPLCGAMAQASRHMGLKPRTVESGDGEVRITVPPFSKRAVDAPRRRSIPAATRPWRRFQ